MILQIKKATHIFICKWLFLSDPGGIQTPNLLIRSQMLYSVKLRDHFIECKYNNFCFYKVPKGPVSLECLKCLEYLEFLIRA